MSWQQAIMLQPNEQVINHWDGNHESRNPKYVQKGFVRKHQEVSGYSKEKHSGTLVLTNQRLIWFERYGFMSKNVKAAFSIDLRELQGIQQGGSLNKWISITDNQAENTFHLSGTGELAVFRDSIMRQREKLQQTNVSTEIRPEKEIVTMKEVVLVKCSHCGSKYQQGTPKCLTCGANL